MDYVKIKGYKNGILLDLSEECDFDTLCRELADKMDLSRKMLGDTLAAVKIQGRELTPHETDKIYYIIKNHTSMKIACIYSEDEKINACYTQRLSTLLGIEKIQDALEADKTEKQKKKSSVNENRIDTDDEKISFQKFNPAAEIEKKLVNDDNKAFVKMGSLKSGEMINTDKDLVVIGDVPKGSIVASEKSIYILGSLEGEGYAGAITKNSRGDRDAVIFALEMNPEEIKIAEMTYEPKNKVLFGKNKKTQPSVGFLSSKGIVIENYSRGLLNI